jgi:hypothetical protein
VFSVTLSEGVKTQEDSFLYEKIFSVRYRQSFYLSGSFLDNKPIPRTIPPVLVSLTFRYSFLSSAGDIFAMCPVEERKLSTEYFLLEDKKNG